MSSASSRPYHHGDLPRVLREGALELIAERGPMGFTLRELARRVGVSHAAPYRHYVDKRALLTSLAVEGARRLADGIEAALQTAEPDARAQFLAAGHAYVRFALDHAAHFRAMFSSDIDTNDAAYVAARDRSLGLLHDYIAAAQTSGYFGPGDPKSFVIPVFAMHQGLAELISLGVFGTLDAAHVKAVSDLAHGRLLDGLVTKPVSGAAMSKKTSKTKSSRGARSRA